MCPDAACVRRLFRVLSGSGRKSMEHLVEPFATILKHRDIVFVIRPGEVVDY